MDKTPFPNTWIIVYNYTYLPSFVKHKKKAAANAAAYLSRFSHSLQHIAAYLAGFDTQNQGKFGAQELFGVPQEVFIAEVELSAGQYLRFLVAVQRTDHPDQCRPVAAVDQFPIVLLAMIFITYPGIFPDFIGIQQCVKLLSA